MWPGCTARSCQQYACLQTETGDPNQCQRPMLQAAPSCAAACLLTTTALPAAGVALLRLPVWHLAASQHHAEAAGCGC